MNIKPWMEAMRLRTLPLAISNITMGSVLAAFAGLFSWLVFILSVLTAVFLQILSNLANDYGDSIHGADSVDRQGPQRAVQAGIIAPGTMKKAMAIAAFGSIATGVILILVSLKSMWLATIFLALGLLSVWAAINYTSGKNPYGYRGLGDLSVFIFFGILAVGGTFYLQTQQLDWTILLPAASCGLFSIGVLNVNNIRDIESDKLAGKLSIPVLIGKDNAVIYHQVLLFGGLIAAILYTFMHFNSYWQFLFLLIVPLLIKNILAVKRIEEPMLLDPYLKQMALTNLIFVTTFAVGLLIPPIF